MEPGSLDQRVTIERRSVSKDAAGGAVEAWTQVATRWARVEPQSGGEGAVGGQQATRARYAVRMRSIELLPTDRLVWGARKLNIEAMPANNPRDAEVNLICVEAQA